MRLAIDRIRIEGAADRPDPRALRSSIERELTRALDPPAPADPAALARTVGDAVRVAARQEDR